MIIWDGKQGTGYRYIYGCLAMIAPRLSLARRAYCTLLPLLRNTKLVSIECSIHTVEIEVADLRANEKSTVISVSKSGTISAGMEFLTRRRLSKHVEDWNNELNDED